MYIFFKLLEAMCLFMTAFFFAVWVVFPEDTIGQLIGGWFYLSISAIFFIAILVFEDGSRKARKE